MYKLQQYIKSQDEIIYRNESYEKIKEFGYDMVDELEDDLIFLLETLYPNYNIYNKKIERIKQKELRCELIKKYKKCMIIDDASCEAELEAAHIVPFCEDMNNNSIDNGLLLRSCIHKTFDKYYWTINPDTMMIEVKTNINAGEIMKYKGKKINCSDNMIVNLRKRYNEYLMQ